LSLKDRQQKGRSHESQQSHLVAIRCLLVEAEGRRTKLTAAEPLFDDEGSGFVNPADDDAGVHATLEFRRTEAGHHLVRCDSFSRSCGEQ
ncbi:hypothetical protein, partial [Rhizobium leguminosarum]|uniref:hypothetical protein n=1 Tax=Rhizobium leguminosarum TaxID=384 RepID=UPI003F95387E